MQYHEQFSDLVKALEGLPVAAILLMCSHPADVSAALPVLRQAFSGPIGAYSHNPRDEVAPADEPARFAEYGQAWIEMGAQIVGGCCGTGPEHIAALAEVVHGRHRSVACG